MPRYLWRHSAEDWARLDRYVEDVIDRLSRRPHYVKTRQVDFGMVIRTVLAGKTQVATAEIAGVSKSRVGQIVAKAIRMAGRVARERDT